MNSGAIVKTTGDQADDFASALMDGRITVQWLILPKDERMGTVTIINLSEVTHINQYYTIDEIEGEQDDEQP
jgi:hypothetical protein